MRVRLPRGSGLASVSVIRERDKEKKESERVRGGGVEKSLIGSHASFLSCVVT